MWHKIRRLFGSFLSKRDDLSLGQMGELAAANFLRKEKKYRVVERNVSFHEGEIDIVAVDDRTIVFVEVKTRKSDDKGQPWEAVDRTKQKKIVAAATIYLEREGLTELKSRFDIVAVTWADESKPPQIEHILDAFDETED